MIGYEVKPVSARWVSLAFGLFLSAALVWGGIAASPFIMGKSQDPPARLGVPPPPHIEAAAAIMLDLDTGRILYTKQAHDRHPPGELAKILTALVALERGGLDEEARISRDAANAFGWGMTVVEGELMPVSDLLTVMMYRPGSAAALSLAQHIAGSVDSFARQMNAEARRVGAESSRFEDPFGADGVENRSTAYDIAAIASEALKYPVFRDLVSKTRTTLAWKSRGVINVNSLLMREPGAFGIKTSFTPGSGYSLAFAVQRAGHRLLLVILGSPTATTRLMDAESLVGYGIAHFDALSASPFVERDAYRVRDGDTLSGLAQRFDVPISAIRLLNEIADPNELRAGDTLWIPR